jgi:enoyl-[acyl-carrier protein] reductase III
MSNLYSMKNKNFLITGGTRGIGRAISLYFARSGAIVIANHIRDMTAAESLMADSELEGLKISLCRADLTSSKGLNKIESALDNLGKPLDGLVHCAATGVHSDVDSLSARHFDWTFSLNVKAFFNLVKLTQARLVEGSSIIALSSQGAVRAVPTYSLVGSSKGALEALVRHLAVELAPRGIRVNCIRPGPVLTDAWKVMPNKEKRLDEAKRRSPVGRLITAEEVAQTALFLCSEEASGIIGQSITVDGGLGIVD